MELTIYNRQEIFLDTSNASAEIINDELIVHNVIPLIHLMGDNVAWAKINGIKHHVYLTEINSDNYKFQIL